MQHRSSAHRSSAHRSSALRSSALRSFALRTAVVGLSLAPLGCLGPPVDQDGVPVRVSEATFVGDIGAVTDIQGSSAGAGGYASEWGTSVSTYGSSLAGEAMAVLNLGPSLVPSSTTVYRISYAASDDLIVDDDGNAYVRIDEGEEVVDVTEEGNTWVTLCSGEERDNWDVDVGADEALIEVEDRDDGLTVVRWNAVTYERDEDYELVEGGARQVTTGRFVYQR